MKFSITKALLFLLLLTACTQKKAPANNQAAKNDSTHKAAVIPPPPLTDSAKLMRHLDSLPKIEFPFKSEAYNRSFDSVNLSEFRNKKLFHISLKKIPTIIDGGALDDGQIDSTFDLVEKNYRGAWNLIAKTPKFFVVEVKSIWFNGIKMVTLTYNLEAIDAIDIAIADPAGHYPWFADRHSIINKDLTLILQHEYIMNNDGGDADIERSSERWFIDKTGHFRKGRHQKH